MLDREVSDASRRGLDWTNFFLAEIQISFGAFLAFYLATMHWSKEDVGFVLAVSGFVGVIAQIPGGALVDAVRWKRALAAAGVLFLSAAALILALAPTFPLVFAAAILHGLSGGILGPAIAAISLGLTGRRGISLRVGRNFRFSGAGNALTAGLMGLFAAYLSNRFIFLIAATLCIPAIVALRYIRANEIDYARARNARQRGGSLDLQRIFDLGKNRALIAFTVAMAVYQFSNASLLPVVGEDLGAVSRGSLSMAALLIVPQIVVAALAPWIGYWSELWGRKRFLLGGLAAAALRALLFAFVGDPIVLVFIQIFDGVAGAIITVLTILVIADVTSGTGRFNLAQGIFGTVTGAAASIGTGAFGFAAGRYGDFEALVSMSAGIAVAMALLYLFLPETKSDEAAD